MKTMISDHLSEPISTFSFNQRIQLLAMSAHPKVDDGLRLLEEAKSLNLADAETFSSMLRLIGKTQNIELCLALQLFDEAKRLHLDSACVYTDMIYVLSRTKHPNIYQAHKIFKEAREKNALTPQLCVNIMSVIQKAEKPNFLLADQIFQQARMQRKLSAHLYAQMIYLMIRNPNIHFSNIFNLFIEAQVSGFSNEKTYESILYAFSKTNSPNIEMAMSILKEAETFKLETALTYMHMLSILALHEGKHGYDALSLLDYASSLFKKIPNMRNGEFFDLNGLSFGVVYFGLKRRLDEEFKEKRSSPLTLTLSFDDQSDSTSILNAKIQSLRKAISLAIKKREAMLKIQENPLRLSISPITFFTKDNIFSASSPKEERDEQDEFTHPYQH